MVIDPSEFLSAVQLGLMGGGARLCFEKEPITVVRTFRWLFVSTFVAVMVSLWTVSWFPKEDTKHLALEGFCAFFAGDVLAGVRKAFKKFRNGKEG